MSKVTYTKRVTVSLGGKQREYVVEVMAKDYPTNENVEVWIFPVGPDGKVDGLREIGAILDQLPGDPLNAIIDAIDWPELYAQQHKYKEEDMAQEA